MNWLDIILIILVIIILVGGIVISILAWVDGEIGLEFGMYDFWDKSKDKIRLLEKIFSKNILNCYVANIRYNDDNSTIYIYLSEKQEGDY